MAKMSAKETPEEALLKALRSQVQRPYLTLAEATELPEAKPWLEMLKLEPARERLPSAVSTKLAVPDSTAVVKAAVADTYDLAELMAETQDREILQRVSDVVMIGGKRRLRLQDQARANLLSELRGRPYFDQILDEMMAADRSLQSGGDPDPARLPAIWLRRFLSGSTDGLRFAEHRELSAALAARERLQFTHDLPKSVPPTEELRRLHGLAELVEPLRVLVGVRRAKDGSYSDRFVGRNQELTQLRTFVDELGSTSLIETVARLTSKAARAFTGRVAPSVLLVEGRGGLGKSTLLAKFVLDHALHQSSPFPFAYLDFDRADLDPSRPRQLLVEICRQVALQFPEAAEELSRLRANIRTELSKPGADVGPSISIKDPFSQFAAIVQERITKKQRAFLLVLDTLEVVQWNSTSMRELAGLVEEFRAKGLDELRVVASGRADMPELRQASSETAVSMALKPLAISEARAMADALGRITLAEQWDSEWATAIIKGRDSGEARREPLTIRVAVDLLARSGKDEREGLAREIASQGTDASSDKGDFVARLYERRIVNHVRDPMARQLAWPGLVVRRLTKEIARELLAGVCGLSADDAEKAYLALGREVWMVSPEGDALRHRPDLRARTLPLMRKKDPERFNQVARMAVNYFGDRRKDSHNNHVEWIYHRLLAGESPSEVESAIGPDVLSLLARADADFPPESPAAGYLASRTARHRLPPSRIRKFSAGDALFHLSVTAANCFSFDDNRIDPAVLDVANRLEAGSSQLSYGQQHWARALNIKAGAWHQLVDQAPFGAEVPPLVRRANAIFEARVASYSSKRKSRALESSLNEKAGLRTTVQWMVLAKIQRHPIFGALDAQVAGMLLSYKPNPAPSAQAALRTAVVFGQKSRVPAARAWLASRRHGAVDRIREPTVSLAEVSALSEFDPGVGNAFQQRKGSFGDIQRSVDVETVLGVSRSIERLAEEATTGGREARALTRFFSARDEDWIVPLGYAAARFSPGPLSPKIKSRLHHYLTETSVGFRSKPTPVPTEMVGAMRIADEAGDLSGFAHAVWQERNAPPGDLAFLLNCHQAWRSTIAKTLEEDASLTAKVAPVSPSIESYTSPKVLSVDPPKPGPIIYSDDPQKGRWGGKASRSGRTARITVESVEREIFYFSVIVESTDGSELEAPVIFHMHESYRNNVVRVRRIIRGRQAKLDDWSSYGVFAIGVQVKDAKGNWIALEAHLADAPGLPKRFLDK
jgi:hypothetical protein